MRFLARLKGLGIVLILSTLGWAVGIPFLINTSYAGQLSSISATASSSAPSVSTNYMVAFTSVSTIGSDAATFASTTRITFDPLGNAFDLTSLATSTNDISIAGTGLTQVADLAACSVTASEIYVNRIGKAEPADYIEFITCDTDTIAAEAITVNIANAHVLNPAVTGSYVVRLNGTMTDAGDTRIAIIGAVTMSASVDTNVSFGIAGVASSSLVNGDTTSTTTEPSTSAISFGNLSVGTSTIAAQDITVSTNALNGFSVTVTEDGDLRSNSGANINAFKDGDASGVPVQWAVPSGSIGAPNTYGHMGITSEDSTLEGATDPFGDKLYAGLTSTSTRTVLYHTGPADGLTAGVGKTRVGFRVEITSLQEAATDYSNQIIYVVTPVF